MLECGVTRDIFLMACDPQKEQIRHLVIAGFSEMGRTDDLEGNGKGSQSHNMQDELMSTLKSIQIQANRGTSEAFRKGAAEHTVNVLLKFS